MKRKAILIGIASITFLLALGIVLFPLISNAYNAKHYAYLMEDYSVQIQQTDDSLLTVAREQALAYNQSLQPGIQSENAFSEEALKIASDGYWDLLDMNGSGIMGYVEIPSIEVYLPIYHGTEETSLQKGIGHLMGSSLPVGGNSSHAILTAHSGMTSQKMFSDLPQLETGDVFYLKVLGETLAYQVDQIKTVLPHDTTYLGIEHGLDLCTLVTCTPFGINTHRLLVRGERIPYEEAEVIMETTQEEPTESTWEQHYLQGIFIGLAAVLVAVLTAVIWIVWRRHNESR